MQLDQRPLAPPPTEGSALAPRAVLVGVGVAALTVLVILVTLVMRPGGPGGGDEFFGGWLASHHSHSGGHHSKKKKKHKGGHGSSHGDSGSDDDSSSGGDSGSGGDSSSSGDSSSGSDSSSSSGSGGADSSTVDAGGGDSGASVIGGAAPTVAGTGASLSCSQVVSDINSLQQAVNSDPNGVICLQAAGGSGAGSGTLGSLGSTVDQTGNSLGNTLSHTGSSLGRTVGNAKNAIAGGASKILTGAPKQTVLHTTGYSYQDNQGGNNSIISCGIIHKTAGGTGTYDDPITVAVPGHVGKGTQMPCGTRIYVPKYQKYFIVEDTGATDYKDAEHIDIYVDGEGFSKSQSDKCMDPVTTDGKPPVPAILNPPSGEQVLAGPITQGNKCDVADAGSDAGSGSGDSSKGD